MKYEEEKVRVMNIPVCAIRMLFAILAKLE